MRENFIIDVLASDLNAYWKLLPANVKDYLSRITDKNIKQSIVYNQLNIQWKILPGNERLVLLMVKNFIKVVDVQ